MPGTKQVEQELMDLERKYWRAIQEKDAEAAMELSDDPCFVAGAQGVASVDRASLGKMLAAASYTLDEFSFGEDAHVRLLDDDVAILAYTVHEELTVEGEKVSLDAADTSTWVRRDGQWRCALHTESLPGDPFGRDRIATA